MVAFELVYTLLGPTTFREGEKGAWRETLAFARGRVGVAMEKPRL